MMRLSWWCVPTRIHEAKFQGRRLDDAFKASNRPQEGARQGDWQGACPPPDEKGRPEKPERPRPAGGFKESLAADMGA